MKPSEDTPHLPTSPAQPASAGAEQAPPRFDAWELREAIDVSGADAESWLQGQLSQQVRGIEVGAPRFALLLNLQGKIKADLWVTRRGAEHFCLWVPHGLADALLVYFDKYIMMEDVEVTALGLALLELDAHALGVAAPAECRPAGGGDHAFAAGLKLRVVAPEEVKDLPGVHAGCTASPAWDAAAIASGYARFEVDYLAENALPQEVALAEWGVSFTKGCYQGQEPVVMVEHRGKPPRYLVRLEGFEALDTGDATGAPLAGTALAASESGPALGRLGNTSGASGSVPQALALLKRSAAVPGAELIGAGWKWRVRAVLTPQAQQP